MLMSVSVERAKLQDHKEQIWQMKQIIYNMNGEMFVHCFGSRSGHGENKFKFNASLQKTLFSRMTKKD